MNVVGLAGAIGVIGAGERSTCAINAGGAVQCWGLRAGNSSTPVAVPELAGGVREIGVGASVVCARQSDGAVKCWGSNSYGELGDGTTLGHTAPGSVIGLGAGSSSSQTISFGALSAMPLGSGPLALTASASSGLPVSFTSLTTDVCSVSGASVTLLAAGTCTLAADQPGNGSYSAAAQVTQSFEITLATQTITGFAPVSALTYSPGLTFAWSASGGASGKPVVFATTTPAICTVSGSTATVLGVGTCTLTANQAGNATYSAAPQASVGVVITAAGQSISFGALAGRTFGDAPFTLSASASSGLPVSFTSSTPSVCTLAGATVTLVAAGTCTLAADQPGNGSYSAAPQVTQSFAVALRAQTITLDLVARTNLGVSPFTVTATASSGLPVTLTSNTTPVCTVAGNTVTILAIGICTITASQPGSAGYQPAAPVTESLTVNPPGTAQMYYVVPDHLGTPRLITDTNSNPVWRWDNADPFGANLPDENPSGLGAFTYNLRFPGQYYDRETGTYYNYFRDYDPGIGRYIQSDPIELVGGLNTYLYVEGNPVSNKDPLGLFGIAAGFGGGGAQPNAQQGATSADSCPDAQDKKSPCRKCKEQWLKRNYWSAGAFVADEFSLLTFGSAERGPMAAVKSIGGTTAKWGIVKGVSALFGEAAGAALGGAATAFFAGLLVPFGTSADALASANCACGLTD